MLKTMGCLTRMRYQKTDNEGAARSQDNQLEPYLSYISISVKTPKFHVRA